ncbi:MAG: creatininase family protein [candidate division KSB1 bacterium]|nr:creatininase family protein [candidate division KSB1 bacterium]
MIKTWKTVLLLVGCLIAAQPLPVQYEEMSAPQFLQALERSGKICIIPLGILEKHGPHLPLGTDLLDVRRICLLAAEQEYAVVFPPYYFGQIYEAQHQPGTIAYRPQLVWNILQETCDELGRNGFEKIILVNGHGGNNYFLPYFCQAQLQSPRSYAVFLFQPEEDPAISEEVRKLRKTATGGHADEEETSTLLSHRPDLVHTEKAGEQSGEDLNRLAGLTHAYTGIWWYAKYPNHYAGDGRYADPRIGNLLINSEARQLADLIKRLKTDHRPLELLREFYKQAAQPTKTPQ